MKNISILLVLVLALSSCEKDIELCNDKAPIVNCMAEDFHGEWELLGFEDIIPADACLSTLEKKTGEGERTLVIAAYEENQSEGILIDGAIFRISDCSATNSDLHLSSPIEDFLFETKVILRTEDVLERHSRLVFGTTVTLYRRK